MGERGLGDLGGGLSTAPRMPRLSATVAICTWNRCELLRQTLRQLQRVTVPSELAWEVLVVNNNCSDQTEAVLDEFQALLPLRRVHESTPGLSHARNAALAASSADYIVFTDDDVLVDESWLVELVAASRAFPEAATIGGVIDPWFVEEPDPDLADSFDVLRRGFCGIDLGPEPRILSDDQYVWGANMAYRRSAIGDLRFDPAFGPTGAASTIGGDEVHFQRRLRDAGHVVLWWPKMRVRHYVDPSRMSLTYLLRFTEDKGVQRVLLSPPGVPGGRQLFGAPAWLWRRAAWAWGNYCLARSGHVPAGEPQLFSGRVATRSVRAQALSWRREAVYLQGMIKGSRAARTKQDLGPAH